VAKKKYSINWEDDLPISFEVDGVQYESLEDVPDAVDCRRLESMLDSSLDADFNDPEFDQLRKETEKIDGASVEKIILRVFTGIAALMLMIAGISTLTTLQKLAREESAPGIVTDVVKRQYVDPETDNVSVYYYPTVEFKSRDGKRHTLELTEGSNPPSNEVGDEVTILYEPDNPSNARIKSFGSSASMWILPGITGILGIGFLVAVLVVQKYLFTPADA
jgi:hypothetical protein